MYKTIRIILSKRHTGFFTPKQTLRLREIIKTSY